MIVELTLPFPPSTNRIWRRAGTKIYLTEQAKAYRREVAEIVMISRMKRFLDRLVSVEMRVFPPDKRMRDIDNVLKSLLDALQFAKFIENDSQIKKLFVEMCEPLSPRGCVKVKISEIEQ